MEKTIKYIKELIRHNKVKQISKTLFEVENNSVKIQTKKGRRILLCDCENSGMFADNNFCVHKFAVIIYLSNKDFLDRLDKLIKQYEGYKNIKALVSIDCFINDLESIRRKW